MTTSAQFIIAADIGGTHATFALAEVTSEGPRIIAEDSLASRDYQNFAPLLKQFLDRPSFKPLRDYIAGACFAVAGPVKDNTAVLTNLGWQVEGEAVAEQFKLPNVSLINDFQAAGLGLGHLPSDSFDTLQAAEADEDAPSIIVGAGTGLGVGMIVKSGDQYRVVPSEAGHADFAPTDELQDKLLLYLRRNFGRVSWERVISGPGLMRVFSFLQDSGLGLPSKQLLEATKRPGVDPAEIIADYGLHKLDPLAVRALDLFVAAYGAFAGNMALGSLARGGVYVAGGIAPKIISRLKEGAFMRAFTGRGAFTPLLSGIPVKVVMDAKVGVRGALSVATRTLI
ncbi:MAG: glucokinase [Burkholderiales bacterium]|jgi:glucokinase